MHIAVLKEKKICENRVALIPEHAAALTQEGHTIFLETGAGNNAGFPDSEYIWAGAQPVPREEALSEAALILKVKAPLEEEYRDYRPDHILFTYLHFDENIPPAQIHNLIKSGFLGIAYEWVGTDNEYPLLAPMSRITGYLFAQKAIELTTRERGFLCSGLEKNFTPARVLIIGMGTIGMSVYRFCKANGLAVVILDKHPETLATRLEKRFPDSHLFNPRHTEVILFESENPGQAIEALDSSIENFDLIFNCAVRRSDLPKDKMEYLITEKMVQKMRAGTVICDTTACDRDLIETCVSSPDLEHFDLIHGVIHYNTDHIPSLVAQSSSRLLNDATLPFIRKLAASGCDAVLQDAALENGTSCYKGFLTHRYTAEKKRMRWRPIRSLINQ